VACHDPYLACLLLERKQLVNSSLWVALEHGISLGPASPNYSNTFPSFSASGIWESASLLKSLSALSTSPLDMVAVLSCGPCVRECGVDRVF
jgi:hypothetical protein